jgi:SRSO17 transposase
MQTSAPTRTLGPGRAVVPPSGRPPQQALSPSQIQAAARELLAYHEQFKDLFARREQRQWSLFYLRGQLSDLERKTVEPMVHALRGVDPAAVRAVQLFLGEGAWDDAALLRRHQQLVAQSLAEPQGVLIVDGSGFPKQGKFSVGVARQYCGHLGKVANCQQGVFAAYSSSKGATFVDCRLYMPQHWFEEEHAELRERCGVPTELRFTTEPMLALGMVKSLAKRGELPFAWVLGDETYGSDPKFLDGVAAAGKYYFVEVPKTTQVYLGAVQILPAGSGPLGRPRRYPRVAPGTAPPVQVHHLANLLPPQAWELQELKEGTKGPVQAQVACVPVTRCQSRGRHRPGAPAWLILRRALDPESELKMFLSNAPSDCSSEQLGRLTAMRWPIETVLEEAKGELGMDHYEVRGWRGWHHQMTLTFLAHHFLIRLRRSQEKKVLRSRYRRPKC